MTNEELKKIIDRLCSSLYEVNQDDFFLIKSKLFMINYLFENIKNDQYLNIFKNKSNEKEIINQITIIFNQIKEKYIIYSKNNEKIIKKIIDECQRLESEFKFKKQIKDKHTNLYNKLKKISAQEENDFRKTSKEIIKVLDDKSITCSELYNEYKNKIAVLKESLDALENIENEKKENIAHIEENKYVLEKLKKVGIEKEEDVNKKVVELESKIDELLKEYDLILSNLLEYSNKEKDEIKRRQKLVKNNRLNS